MEEENKFEKCKKLWKEFIELEAWKEELMSEFTELLEISEDK